MSRAVRFLQRVEQTLLQDENGTCGARKKHVPFYFSNLIHPSYSRRGWHDLTNVLLARIPFTIAPPYSFVLVSDCVSSSQLCGEAKVT